MADFVAVMHEGKLVEQAPSERLFTAPVHPYTRSLLANHSRPVTAGNDARSLLANQDPPATAVD
jgi:ABC-type dipeptide/oligopeptide/nickel transport system ATPase component